MGATCGPGLEHTAFAWAARGLEGINAREEDLHTHHILLQAGQLGIDLLLRPLSQRLSTLDGIVGMNLYLHANPPSHQMPQPLRRNL
jgi:hypothetical protein